MSPHTHQLLLGPVVLTAAILAGVTWWPMVWICVSLVANDVGAFPSAYCLSVYFSVRLLLTRCI